MSVVERTEHRFEALRQGQAGLIRTLYRRLVEYESQDLPPSEPIYRDEFQFRISIPEGSSFPAISRSRENGLVEDTIELELQAVEVQANGLKALRISPRGNSLAAVFTSPWGDFLSIFSFTDQTGPKTQLIGEVDQLEWLNDTTVIASLPSDGAVTTLLGIGEDGSLVFSREYQSNLAIELVELSGSNKVAIIGRGIDNDSLSILVQAGESVTVHHVPQVFLSGLQVAWFDNHLVLTNHVNGLSSIFFLHEELLSKPRFLPLYTVKDVHSEISGLTASSELLVAEVRHGHERDFLSWKELTENPVNTTLLDADCVPTLRKSTQHVGKSFSLFCHSYFALPKAITVFPFEQKQTETLRDQAENPQQRQTIQDFSLPITFYTLEEESQWKSAPLFLTVYGAYGEVLTPKYDRIRRILSASGWVIGDIHLPGGGFFGREWQKLGRKNRALVLSQLHRTISELSAHRSPRNPLVLYGRSAGAVFAANIANPNVSLLVLDSPLLSLQTAVEDSPAQLRQREDVEWREALSIDPMRLSSGFFGSLPVLLRSGELDTLTPIHRVEQWIEARENSAKIFLARRRLSSHRGERNRFDALRSDAELAAAIIALTNNHGY